MTAPFGTPTRPLRLALALFVATVLCACAPRPRTVPEPPRAPEIASPALPDTGIALVVYKERRLLTVMSDGFPLHEFPVVVGRRNHGPKRFEGDNRTPEGLYRVTQKRAHPRWRYFIEIDYPNGDDVSAYVAEIEEGRVPVFDGEFPGMGGRVGIHGSDKPIEQAAGFDWTQGCVAMDNDGIARVYELVDAGTPVLILP